MRKLIERKLGIIELCGCRVGRRCRGLPIADLIDDHRMIAGIRRKELRHLFGRQRFEQNRASDLVVHVAAQIPRHGFAPRQRVDRGPLRDFVIGAEDGQTQNFIFKA